MRRIIRSLWRLGKWALAVVLLTWAASEAAVLLAARGRTFNHLADVPPREFGIVLGTSKFVGPGRPNLHYRYRIDAAAELFRAGKVQRLIVSGNGRERGYNEPRMMKADLVERGVPAERITCDDFGLRTYDSVVRAREVFHVREGVVISQAAHNERAIFLGRFCGVDLIGWNAQPVGVFGDPRTAVRERLARVKAVADILLRRGKSAAADGNVLSVAGAAR